MSPNRNVGNNPVLAYRIQPNIGLDGDARQAVVEILNHALANEVILGMKTRNAHWNVSGAGFFEMFTLFGAQYARLDKICDEIAERVRILGGIVVSSFQEVINLARLEEQPGSVPDILHLVADHEAVIRMLREDVRKCTDEYEDEGTSGMLVSVMRAHEKIAWMLRSSIEPGPALTE